MHACRTQMVGSHVAVRRLGLEVLLIHDRPAFVNPASRRGNSEKRYALRMAVRPLVILARADSVRA